MYSDREGSEDESPFAALHRHSSFGRDSDTEDSRRDMFRMHSLRLINLFEMIIFQFYQYLLKSTGVLALEKLLLNIMIRLVQVKMTMMMDLKYSQQRTCSQHYYLGLVLFFLILFSFCNLVLIFKVRDLTQRLNVDGRPGFPTSRLLSSHFDHGTNFWNLHNRPDPLSRYVSEKWRYVHRLAWWQNFKSLVNFCFNLL